MAATFTLWDRQNLDRLVSEMAQLQSQLLSLQILANTASMAVGRYATLALMKAEPNFSSVKLWILLGKNAAGDGLMGGEYYYDATRSDTPNDSSIIQLTSTSVGRLIKFQ